MVLRICDLSLQSSSSRICRRLFSKYWRCFGTPAYVRHCSQFSYSDESDKVFIAKRFRINDNITIPNGNLPRGKRDFMPVKKSLEIMSKNVEGYPCFDHIPLGLKEDTCFLVDNTKNLLRRQQKKKELFVDDCGSWNTKRTAYTGYYYFLENDQMTSVRFVDGEYITLRHYITGLHQPIDPQPQTEDVLQVFRYKSVNVLSEDYKRCITIVKYLPQCFEAMFDRDIMKRSFVQYKGTFPGYAPFFKNKHTNVPYLRMPEVISNIISLFADHGGRNVSVIFDYLVEHELLLRTKQNYHLVFRQLKCAPMKKDETISSSKSDVEQDKHILMNPIFQRMINNETES